MAQQKGHRKYDLASKEWLVVLYLSHFTRNIDDPESPTQVTAGGIAQVTGLKRSQVDVILKDLTSSGLVRSWSNHIRGKPRKGKVFFLTREGENLSMYMMDEAKHSTVNINAEELDKAIEAHCPDPDHPEKGMGGTSTLYERLCEAKDKRIPLMRVGRLFDFSPTLLEIMMALEGSRTISLEKVKQAHSRTMAMRPTKEWIDFSGHVQKVTHFFGREPEMGLAEDFLESVTHQVLVIKGIDGIGKTSLASAIASMVKGTRHIFWYDFNDHTSIKHMYTALAMFLGKLKVQTLKNYLSYEDNPTIREVIHILEGALFDTTTMLVFEDVHKTSDERVTRFLMALKEAMAGLMGAKVVITGRTIPPFYDRQDTTEDGTVLEIPLVGLRDEAATKLLEAQGVKRDKIKDHLNITKGHPIYIELTSKLGLPPTYKTVNFYIETELDNRLSNIEKKLLSLMSVFRHSAPSRAFLKRAEKFEDGSSDVPIPHTLDALKDKDLVRSDADEDNLSLHDVVREHFYDLMLPKVRRSAHSIAGTYYIEEREDLNRLEVLYHLIRSEEHERAADYAVDKKDALFATGYFEDLLSLLGKIDRGLLTSDLMLDLSLLEGDIFVKNGQLEEAVRALRLASKMAGQLGKDRARAGALFKLGDTLRRLGFLDQAGECYNQGIDILELDERPKDLAVGHLGLGLVAAARTAYSEACEHFTTGLLEARKARQIHLASEIVTNMGDCLLKKGDVAGAAKVMADNMRMLEANRDPQVLARAHALNGLLYYLKEDWTKATKSFVSGAQSARKSGNSQLLATNLLEGAIPFQRKGEEARAQESLEEAEDIFYRLDNKKGLAQVEVKRAELLGLSGDEKGAEQSYRSAIKALERLKDRSELSSVYFSLASLLEKGGRKDEAMELRQKGMALTSGTDAPPKAA